MKKVLQVIILLLVMIPLLIFGGVKIFLYAIEEDGNAFQEDSFGIAARAVLPDASSLPVESELYYHRFADIKCYLLTLRFDSMEEFEANRSTEVPSDSACILCNEMEFYSIPTDDPWEYVHYYIVFDRSHQRIFYLYVKAERYTWYDKEEYVLRDLCEIVFSKLPD